MSMKILIACLLAGINLCTAAQDIDSVLVPRGVSYKYCSPSVLEDAKTIVQKEISDSVGYELNDGILFVGPTLWSRYRQIPTLEKIKGGSVSIIFNKEKLPAKITQDDASFRKIWDQFRKEVSVPELELRKATSKELQYYWGVISFDIEEPLLIADTGERRFILNISPKNMKLLWLDEVPAGF